MTDTRSSAANAALRQTFQKRVLAWLMECFSMEVCRDGTERNHRFLEEALELVQSLGCTRSEAQQLVDYVFDRPVGEPMQELGGVQVTLAALCFPHDLDMEAAAETELARVWTKIDKIRAKQAAKPKHSPLPQHHVVAQSMGDCGEARDILQSLFPLHWMVLEQHAGVHDDVILGWTIDLGTLRRASKFILSSPAPSSWQPTEAELALAIYESDSENEGYEPNLNHPCYVADYVFPARAALRAMAQPAVTTGAEAQRVRGINKDLDEPAFALAWDAFQKTPVDLVADSDDEQCRCVHNAIATYLAALPAANTAGDVREKAVEEILSAIQSKRGSDDYGISHALKMNRELAEKAASTILALSTPTPAPAVTQSPPDLAASQNTAERDPSVMPDWTGGEPAVSGDAREALELAYLELKKHDADYHHRTSIEINNKIVDALSSARAGGTGDAQSSVSRISRSLDFQDGYNAIAEVRAEEMAEYRETVIEECAKEAERLYQKPGWSPHYKNAALTIAGFIRNLASLPKTDPEPGKVEAPTYEFPYEQTFHSIAAAVEIYPSKEQALGISISVRKFQEAFNGHHDAAALQQAPGTDAAVTRPKCGGEGE